MSNSSRSSRATPPARRLRRRSRRPRLKAAGFPDSDIFVGGAIPRKPISSSAYHGYRCAQAHPASRSHRRRRSQTRKTGPPIRSNSSRKTATSTGAAPATTKAQAAVWIAQSHSLQTGRFQARPRHHRGTHRRREGGGPYQRGPMAAPKITRADRRRVCVERRRLGESLDWQKISNDVQVSEKYVINYRFRGVTTKAAIVRCPFRTMPSIASLSAHRTSLELGFPLKTNEVTALIPAKAKIETWSDKG